MLLQTQVTVSMAIANDSIPKRKADELLVKVAITMSATIGVYCFNIFCSRCNNWVSLIAGVVVIVIVKECPKYVKTILRRSVHLMPDYILYTLYVTEHYL